MNGLSAKEVERLAILFEEAAEIVVIAGKILRHGYESYNPDDSGAGSNREQLESEIGDLGYIIGLMCDCGDLSEMNIDLSEEIASRKKPRYMHYKHQTTEETSDTKTERSNP